ncbi:fluoride efflux transporter CrcB [Brucella sp. BO3]|uniref:fluoride efflux transporter CrcB n=1 Tax=unclassified Brucella TaxID=2632610 RepID=UPI00084FAB4C|nr:MULTISPECIES: fluoride efflux transporter CrcB [unclassified Brucella]OEI84635.1 camphor resistance protein CrcB [Brucella sp. B13-0095]QGA58146.1 fluoride efflux transporter CrcB [Brucella sp. 2280]QMV27916.1 fluoride efflux transporter CrcB [Brucella sp. BO3]
MSVEASILVLVGGFIGGVMRFFLSGYVGRRIGETFPWGTFVVNVSGAFFIGMAAGLGARLGGIFSTTIFHEFIMVGLLGGYTTVSSFCLQSVNLMLDGEQRQALFNIVASALLCVLAVAAGYGGIMWIMEWPG